MADKKPENPNIRMELLEPAEAWHECKKRMVNALPDLPALILVIVMGIAGAAIAKIFNIKVGGEDFRPYYLNSWLPMLVMGAVGGVSAVFLLARTDTSKLIHCSLVGLLSGMAGPYLAIKALKTIVPLDYTDKIVAEAAEASDATTNTTNKIVQLAKRGDLTNIPVQVTQFTAELERSFQIVKEAGVKSASDKEKVIAETEPALEKSLEDLASVSTQAPQEIYAAVAKVGALAKESGSEKVAQQAQLILAAAKQNSNVAIQKAAQSAIAPVLYFITPSELSNEALNHLRGQLQAIATFSTWKLRSAVHPTRAMDDGIEVVYYNRLDEDDAANRVAAEELGEKACAYFDQKAPARVRLGILPNGERRAQVDLQIGPDVVKQYLAPKGNPDPTATTAPSPAPRNRRN